MNNNSIGALDLPVDISSEFSLTARDFQSVTCFEYIQTVFGWYPLSLFSVFFTELH